MAPHTIHAALLADVLRWFSGSRDRRYSGAKKHWADWWLHARLLPHGWDGNHFALLCSAYRNTPCLLEARTPLVPAPFREAWGGCKLAPDACLAIIDGQPPLLKQFVNTWCQPFVVVEGVIPLHQREIG